MQGRKVSGELKPGGGAYFLAQQSLSSVRDVASPMQVTAPRGARDSFSSDIDSATCLTHNQGTSVLTRDDQSVFAGPVWLGPPLVLGARGEP